MAKQKGKRRKKQKLTVAQALLVTLALIAAAAALFQYEPSSVQAAQNAASAQAQPNADDSAPPVLPPDFAESTPKQETPSDLPPADGTTPQTFIHTIDVGQGDATLIRQNGAYCLIDAGTKESADRLVAYLQEQGVQKLDLVIMTHAHADHIGGMPEILASFAVDRFIMPNFSLSEVPTTVIFEKTLKALNDQPDCEVQTVQLGERFALDNATLTVVGAGVRGDGQNNTSICTLFEAPGVRYLNTGDAEKEAEAELVKSGQSLRADIFKAGHHGSSTSNTAALLAAASPRYIVISCGAGNDYGHPHAEAMSRFADTNAVISRTDETGSVVYTVTNGVLEVR